MKAFRTKLAAVMLMGFAVAGVSASTATAEAPSQSAPREVELGGMENLNGYCQSYGWPLSMPLDTGDAYSWVCTDGSSYSYINMDDACVWHYPAYPWAVGYPLDDFNAWTWRCYA